MTTTTQPTTSPRTWGLVQVCAAGLLWGTGGFAVQLIRERADLSVLTISGYRIAIASAVLLAVVAASGQVAELTRALRTRTGPVVVMGLSTASYQVLYFSAVVWVGVSVSTVVSLGLAPLLITAWDSVRARQLPHPRQLAVLFAALLGLVLISLSAAGSDTATHPVLGILAALGSGTGYAVATVLGHRLAQHANPLPLTTAATAVGAVALLPVGLLSGLGPSVLVSPDPTVFWLLLYLGVFTMAGAYWLLYAGLRTTPGSAAVVATLLEPVTAATMATLFLGERLGAAGAIGAVLILAAVAGLHRGPTADAPPPG